MSARLPSDHAPGGTVLGPVRRSNDAVPRAAATNSSGFGGHVSSTPEAKATLVGLDAVDVRWSSRARSWRLEVPWGEAPRLTVPVGTRHAAATRLLAETKQRLGEQQARPAPRR